MTSPVSGINAILTAATGVVSAGWVTQLGVLLSEPDQAIAIRQVGGFSSEIVVPVDYPSIQILVRGSSGAGGYESSYAKMVAVKNALIGIPSRPTAWTDLTSCVPRGEIQELLRDDQGRPLWSYNVNLIVTLPAPAGYRVL